MEMEKLADIFEAVKVLTLRPDDVIVFRAPCAISTYSAERIRRFLRGQFGADRQVLVLTEGCDIDIVRPEADRLKAVVRPEAAITQEEADRLKAEWESKYAAPPWWKFWPRG